MDDVPDGVLTRYDPGGPIAGAFDGNSGEPLTERFPARNIFGMFPVDGSEQPVDSAAIARLLGVSRATIHAYAKAGEIPAFKVGRAWRFFPSEVLAHLQRPTDLQSRSARAEEI